MIEFFEFGNFHFYIALVLAGINAGLMCFEGYKFLQIYQLSGYHNKGYFEWVKLDGKKYFYRLLMLSVLSSVALMITNVVFNSWMNYLAYAGLLVYFGFSVIFIKNVYQAPKKTPLQMTNRMNRSIVLLFIVYYLISFGFILLSSITTDVFRFGAVALTPITIVIIVPFVNWLMKPLEKAIKNKFVREAKKKLADYPQLIKIGITGSYGKTSTKNFLATILQEKYSVCNTPFSYNTPMGITKTINNFLEHNHQVFIAEMGARQLGDVKELCDLIRPQYGIITSVAPQHLETFKTLENVKKTKAELSNYLQNQGFCVYNIDNNIVKEIAKHSSAKKCKISIKSELADIYADNIVISTKGTEFDLHIGKDEVAHCKTKLLGMHNISNLLCCVGIARELKLTLSQIITGIEKVMPVEHRLQLIEADNGVTILDDSYNASIEGSERALDVMRMFTKRRKIIITPGLVELGRIERLENYKFGARMSQVADLVIIVSKANYLSIKQGLLDNKFDESKIYQTDNMPATKKLLAELLLQNDVVLWENDLPDNYS